MIALLLLFILPSYLAEGTVEFQYDTCGGQVKKKKVDVRYDYYLAKNVWTQFPDMFITFNLDYAQEVKIRYNIATFTANSYHFYVRVYIDGQNDRMLGCFLDYMFTYTCRGQNEVYLSEGQHTVQVLYHTDSPRQISKESELPAVLQVKYVAKAQ